MEGGNISTEKFKEMLNYKRNRNTMFVLFSLREHSAPAYLMLDSNFLIRRGGPGGECGLCPKRTNVYSQRGISQENHTQKMAVFILETAKTSR